MTEQTPLYMDISNVYSGDELGLPYRDIMGEGVVGSNDLAVSAGTGNSVNVAAGVCWVTGDSNPALQPTYRCYNDATVNKGISPDPSNPRYVQVIAQITDQGFAGTGRNWQIVTTHGTPAASPSVPTTPASALPIANILVPAAAASSAAYTITDLRTRAKVGGGDAGGSRILAVLGPLTAGANNLVVTVPTPTQFTSLEIDWVVRSAYSAASANWYANFNGDGGASYYTQRVAGAAAAASASENLATTAGIIAIVPAATASAGAFGHGRTVIPFPGESVSLKGVVTTSGYMTAATSGTTFAQTTHLWWLNSSPIASISFAADSGFAAGSRIVVRGVY